MKVTLAGTVAGMINGLFGTGGGMVLVPLLTLSDTLEEDQVFSASVSIILPICLVSLAVYGFGEGLPFGDALPYLLGGAGGGLLAALTGKCIPVSWLHRLLGALILWGGIRYIC